nr:hypothetical protein [Tanacetum cinerariifolium]
VPRSPEYEPDPIELEDHVLAYIPEHPEDLMRAAVPSTYHSLLTSGTPPLLPIPLPVPSTSRRAEIPEANMPPRKRLLLTAPRPGCEAPPSPDYISGLEAPPSPDYIPGPEAPPSPDYIPRPEAPPSPDYISWLEYPEYLSPADDVLPTEEQPLPVSPTTESPGYITESEPKMEPKEEDEDDEKSEEDYIKYPTNGGDDDADNDGDDLSEDDADDGEEEESSDSDEGFVISQSHKKGMENCNRELLKKVKRNQKLH